MDRKAEAVSKDKKENGEEQEIETPELEKWMENFRQRLEFHERLLVLEKRVSALELQLFKNERVRVAAMIAQGFMISQGMSAETAVAKGCETAMRIEREMARYG